MLIWNHFERCAEARLSMLLRTIGYEGSSIDAFVSKLLDADVDQIIDVRELPLSRKAGFSKKALEARLSASRIGYLHLRGLGDPKPGRIAARAGNVAEFEKIYRAHLQSKWAVRDLSTATDTAIKNRACLMCFEADPIHCHRSIVAEALSLRAGFEIEHLRIIDPMSILSMKDLRNAGRSHSIVR